MPTLLSPVLSRLDLPLAELSAARLDGELFGIADCYLPGDLPEGAAVRAAALRAALPHDRLIAEQQSAAWIWGVLDAAPSPHRFAAAIGARVGRRSSSWMRVREVVIADDDRTELAGLEVTTPLRTALDLLRGATFAAAERQLVQALMAMGGFTAHDCREGIDARRNLPHKHEARARLESVTQPELTRYTS
jgi:hypothetical protein